LIKESNLFGTTVNLCDHSKLPDIFVMNI
jgi:hypothetical protein